MIRGHYEFTPVRSLYARLLCSDPAVLRQRHQKENCQKGCDSWILFHDEKVQYSSKGVGLHVVLRKENFPPTWSYLDLDLWYIHLYEKLTFFSLHHFGRLCPNSIRSIFLCWSDRFAEHSWGSFTSTRLGLSAKKQANETTRFTLLHHVLGHVAMYRGEKPRRPILAEPAWRTWLDTEEEGIWNVQKSIPETFRSGWEQQELIEKRSRLRRLVVQMKTCEGETVFRNKQLHPLFAKVL